MEGDRVEKSIFDLEVREKKNQAFLNKAKTGAKGGSSSRKGVRTPFDFMSRQEKKNLIGEVRVTNMYTSILNWTEFNLKDKETQKELLTKWREVHSNNKIMEELAIGRDRPFNSQSYADLVKELGCPRKTRQVHPDPTTKKRPRNAKVKSLEVAAIEVARQSQLEFETMVSPEPVKEVVQQIITSGLHLEYHGEYTADELAKIFTKMQLLVDGESNKFKISLAISECDK